MGPDGRTTRQNSSYFSFKSMVFSTKIGSFAAIPAGQGVVRICQSPLGCEPASRDPNGMKMKIAADAPSAQH